MVMGEAHPHAARRALPPLTTWFGCGQEQSHATDTGLAGLAAAVAHMVGIANELAQELMSGMDVQFLIHRNADTTTALRYLLGFGF